VAERARQKGDPARELGGIHVNQAGDELATCRDDHVALFKGVASDHLARECY
jgi:hypothetical protein